ncbi:hypothetical protein D9758_016217 [Tetrapyrgos nigripes]|uniref:Helicase ATP-binding domain-containing protein n=1 Tax=Tetrapyrgos nigripes TaxID=182062 RepID=A0A8H5CL78_9AGAR|nr:hypothetical protein D9758_016217 [Tetrapyrgos nigripes]
MPSITAAEALIRLHTVDKGLNYPWCLPQWQSLTGVKHGLFPVDDAHLPAGLTRQDSIEIKSFFDQFVDLPEEFRSKFVAGGKGSAAVPGHKIFLTWINENWEKWGIHSAVVESFHENNVHPISIMLSGAKSSVNNAWPPAELYVPAALESIAIRLFGDEAFDDNGFLLGEVRKNLNAFAQRSWSRLRQKFRSDKRRIMTLEDKAIAAIEDASSGGQVMTATSLTRIIKDVAMWKELAILYKEHEARERAEEKQDELEEVLARIRVTKESKKKAKKTRKSDPDDYKRPSLRIPEISNLTASPEEIVHLSHLYAAYFLEDDDDGGNPVSTTDEHLQAIFNNTEEGDLGMEEEAHMDPRMLAHSLGFKQNGLPLQFNDSKHPSGATIWDHPKLFTEPSSNPSHQLRLHWHQQAGIHSILRNVFSSTPNKSSCTGVLVADDVGLGKTALCLATIATLNQYILLQERKEALPSILRKHQTSCILYSRFLTFRFQEIKVFFCLNSVDIFVYDCPKTGNADFWLPDSPFSQSKQKPHNKIILTTHSSLQNEYSSVFQAKAAKSKAPWELPARKPGGTLDGTIFAQEFLSVTVDEIHEMRNVNAKHYSVLALFNRSNVRIGLTGTPLLTAPKDLTSLGRLLSVPGFLTEESVKEEKEYTVGQKIVHMFRIFGKIANLSNTE